jgi:hypothetical protein
MAGPVITQYTAIRIFTAVQVSNLTPIKSSIDNQEHTVLSVSNVSGSTVSRATHVSIKLTKSYSFWKFYTSLHVSTNMVIIRCLKVWMRKLLSFCIVVLVINIWSPLYACVFEVAGCSSCCVMLSVFFTNESVGPATFDTSDVQQDAAI